MFVFRLILVMFPGLLLIDGREFQGALDLLNVGMLLER